MLEKSGSNAMCYYHSMFRFLLNVSARVKNGMLELLFPTRCLGCGSPSSKERSPNAQTTLLRGEMRSKQTKAAYLSLAGNNFVGNILRDTPTLLCETCKTAIAYRNNPAVAPSVHAAVHYRHPITEKIIWTLKYRGDRRAADVAAGLLWELCGEVIADYRSLAREHIILTGIPSSPSERRRRNINHTDAIIQRLRFLYLDDEKFIFIPGAISKIKDTPPQMTLPREKRLTNLTNTFHITQPEAVAGKVVFVFDDVTTTGATFAEAKRALREAGAKEVACFAVAH